ncbi:MAG: TSUP family transporter, partial [Promethearchaeia archaeon]
MEITTGLIIILIILGFSVSLVNNAFGMGYGMISTPVLLFLGFSPLVVVPASLLSQTVLGFAGTFFHSIYKNVDLETKKQQNAKIAMVFTLFGLIGTTVAIFIAISLNEIFMISYIAIMVSIIGFFLLKDVSFQFSWRYIFLISSIAAFNQALVGGGYGPLATSGQLMS